MRKTGLLIIAVFVSTLASSNAQIHRTSIPIGNAVNKALEKTSITGDGARPFHIKVLITEPGYPDSPYQGVIEEWWVSKDQWRREVTGRNGLRQTIVFTNDQKTEKDEGDYFPLWLRNFVTAVFDPIPNASAWTRSGIVIEQITFPNGAKSAPCARAQSKIGFGDRATDAFFNVCFDGEGRLTFYGSPRYSMEFHGYRDFHTQQVARKLISGPEPGTLLVGQIEVLEDEAKVKDSEKLLAPLGTNDNRFETVAANPAQMEQLAANDPPVIWPGVPAGKLRGHLAIYISADSKGQVREAWPLNSDNARLDGVARDQVKKWKLKPAVDAAGRPVQVDGGLGFAFQTKIENPLPIVTGADIGKFASGCSYRPLLPDGLLPSGTSFTIRTTVDQNGKDEGEVFPDGIPWSTIQKTGLDIRNCRFTPYVANGKPTEYFVDFKFTAP